MDYWDIDEVVCYDPCYMPFSKLPTGNFDGVISTDVLEYCPEQDVPWIIDEIFGFAARFIFAETGAKRRRRARKKLMESSAPGWLESREGVEHSGTKARFQK